MFASYLLCERDKQAEVRRNVEIRRCTGSQSLAILLVHGGKWGTERGRDWLKTTQLMKCGSRIHTRVCGLQSLKLTVLPRKAPSLQTGPLRPGLLAASSTGNVCSPSRAGDSQRGLPPLGAGCPLGDSD